MSKKIIQKKQKKRKKEEEEERPKKAKTDKKRNKEKAQTINYENPAWQLTLRAEEEKGNKMVDDKPYYWCDMHKA